jgi:hypothetical protein
VLAVGRLKMNRKIMVASVVLAVAITAIGDAASAEVKKSRAHQYGTRQSDLQHRWPPAMAGEQAPAEGWKCRYQGGPKAPMTCSR